MTTQTGPRLTITGTCEGCCWHAVPVPGERRCTEPSAQRKIARSVGAKAPAWCPELPAARLALGLLPPTFPARFAEALYASDDGKGSGALHALLAEVGGVAYDPENDPRYNGAPAKKKGGKR